MCDNDRIRAMLDTVIAHLTQNEFRFATREDRPIVLMSVSCRNGTYPVAIDVEDAIFAVLTHFGCHAPPERRVAVAELLSRVNYRLVVGNFEMDFHDGEIRFRNALDLRCGELTDGMVECVLRSSFMTMDRFVPALAAVISNDVSPEDAIALVLGDQNRREAS